MNPINREKIRAVKKRKSNQLLDNHFLHCLTVLAFGLLCSLPFWHPSISSFMEVLLFVVFPKTCSVLLSYKFAFIVGNLIVVILMGESKMFSSKITPVSDVLYDEYINRSQSLQSSSTTEIKRPEKLYVNVEEQVKRTGELREDTVESRWAGENEYIDGNNGFALPAEELTKRADDFIARVNLRRKVEARVEGKRIPNYKGGGREILSCISKNHMNSSC